MPTVLVVSGAILISWPFYYQAHWGIIVAGAAVFIVGTLSFYNTPRVYKPEGFTVPLNPIVPCLGTLANVFLLGALAAADQAHSFTPLPHVFHHCDQLSIKFKAVHAVHACYAEGYIRDCVPARMGQYVLSRQRLPTACAPVLLLCHITRWCLQALWAPTLGSLGAMQCWEHWCCLHSTVCISTAHGKWDVLAAQQPATPRRHCLKLFPTGCSSLPCNQAATPSHVSAHAEQEAACVWDLVCMCAAELGRLMWLTSSNTSASAL